MSSFKLNQSAYTNMLDGRVLQEPEHIPENIEPKSVAESGASYNGMNGKEEAE